MSLPSGWESVTLGDVTVPKVDQGQPSHDLVPYIDISSIDRHCKTIGDLRTVDAASAPTRARQWVKSGDVLVSMTRPNLNAVALVPEHLDGSVASTGFDVLRTIEVHPEWVFNRVRSHTFIADVCEDLQGVVYPAIRPHDVREHELPLPPLPEQHRIVEAIESYLTRLDAALATLKRVQQNLKRYRASVLKAAVEGRLVPTEAEMAKQEGREYEPASVLLERILVERRERWIEDAAEKGRATAEEKAKKVGKPWTKQDNAEALEAERAKAAKKYKEPVTPDTTDLPELPEGWIWATAEALSDETRSITYGVVKLGPVTSGGVPTLRSSNVRHLRLDLDYVKPISKRISDGYQRTVLQGDEVLVTVRGTLGGVVATPTACVGFNISREVAMIALVEPRLTSLVATFIASDGLQNWIMRHTRGIAYTGINIGTLKQLPIPIPPLAEQPRIVEAVEQHISVAGATEASAIANVRRCQSLRQSILKWAFEGRLVDQDPNDEPASILLERIKAEREAKTSTKKSSRRGGRRKKAT